MDNETENETDEIQTVNMNTLSPEVEYLLEEYDPIHENSTVGLSSIVVLSSKNAAKLSASSASTQNLSKPDEKFNLCECGRVYSTLASFRYHKYECGTQRLFSCPHCSYKGKRNTTLVKHIHAKHRDLTDAKVKSKKHI